MKWLHLLAAGAVALAGVVLGFGAVVCFALTIGEQTSEFVTWDAVAYMIGAVGLATGSAACMRYAARLMRRAEKPSN